MNKTPSLPELTAFLAVARHQSFRVAADELALSPSTLSHMIRALEERLGLRLFNRTTRSVAPTEAGTQLVVQLGPILSGLEQTLATVGMLKARPSGTVRINASRQAARALLRDIVPFFVDRYPDVHIDLVTNGRFIDIVAEGFDAGIRLVEAVPQDMIAVRFGADGRFVAVASPAYLATHGTPQTPDDLLHHACIRFRLPGGRLYRWEFARHGQDYVMDVSGTLTLDDMDLMVDAAIKGQGIAFVSEDTASEALGKGQLTIILDDWSAAFPGYALYYPGHRLVPPSLRAFMDVLKEFQPGRTGGPSHRG